MKTQNQTMLSENTLTSRPTDIIAGFPVRPGFFELNGATPLSNGVNFTAHTRHGTSCELLLFHSGEEEPFAVLPFPNACRIGDVYSMIVMGLDIEDLEYGYRIDGPYEPEKGHIFDKTKVLLDPYAKAVAGQREWGQQKIGSYHARVVRDSFDWEDMPQSTRKISDLIIYELHVRGFTQDSSSGVMHPGTFAGLREKIPYLKELGINAVELMPIFEFDENMNARTVNGKRLLEYWGYNSVNFFSPNTSYASKPEHNCEGTELKELIRELHENGIEVILDVVFNHTAEGNELGKTFCFKGFDNKVYYMLTPEGNYYNFSGCGNTLNCNHPIVRQMILECLRYWTINYRVDGFRFDLASILGRHEDGSPLNNPPLLELLAYDPVLRNVKLIAEAWDAGGLYQVGSFPSWKRWAEWNGRYRDDMRRFLKGDDFLSQAAARRITGSPDLYDPVFRGRNASVNFLTCHDGFTLYDLYSYNEKHNEANGWGNTDGADDNNSWNCGVEGDTTDPSVLALRRKMMMNACAVLMCSRGTPMFLAGDEFADTRYGNNNPYCQDNLISWLDWSLLEKNRALYEFFRYMIHFRKAHACIRKDLEPSYLGFPSMSLHGLTPWKPDLPESSHTACVLFSGYDDSLHKEDLVFLAVNTHWCSAALTLPQLPDGYTWKIAVNTGDKKQQTFTDSEIPAAGSSVLLGERSVIVFVGERN